MAIEKEITQAESLSKHRAPDLHQTEESNFGDFSDMPEYIEVNRGLVIRMLHKVPEEFTWIDVGSGHGMVPKTGRLESMKFHGIKHGKFIGIEPDKYAIEMARETTPTNSFYQTEYIQGNGKDLVKLVEGKIPEKGVDAVSMHDAIHEVPDEDKPIVLKAMFDVLKPGGYISINSAFTDIAMGEAGMGYMRWMRASFTELGGKRKKDEVVTKIHSPKDYWNMLEDAGFNVDYSNLVNVQLSKPALIAISRYPRFAWGVFERFEPAEGKPNPKIEDMSQALINALGDDVTGIKSLPRVWFEMIGRKFN